MHDDGREGVKYCVLTFMDGFTSLTSWQLHPFSNNVYHKNDVFDWMRLFHINTIMFCTNPTTNQKISDTWSSTVYTYIFHRRVYDGTFHIAYENKDLILPGLFGAKNETLLEQRIAELMLVADRHLPARASGIRIRPEPCHVDPCRVPLLAKVSTGALENIPKVCNLVGFINALNVKNFCLTHITAQILKVKSSTVCFIDLGKLNLLIISLTWSKSVKQTVQVFIFTLNIFVGVY
jgi:hypothetical protein